ncbi:hypothetical protein AAY473_012782 [Plecturocebus cupreus]
MEKITDNQSNDPGRDEERGSPKRALWKAQMGGSAEVRSSRPVWSTLQNPVSSKNKTEQNKTKQKMCHVLIRWFTPIILALWEPEAGGSQGQEIETILDNMVENPSLLKHKKMAAHSCSPSYLGGWGRDQEIPRRSSPTGRQCGCLGRRSCLARRGCFAGTPARRFSTQNTLVCVPF